MTITFQQMRLLMKTYEQTGSVKTAAAKAGICAAVERRPF